MDAVAVGLDDSATSVAFQSIEQPFVGRWNQLVSQTNWEKGQIIQDWRNALIEAGAPAAEYSDEVWSQRVGGVTGQHVGRLRRVYQRFGASQSRFPGIFWSHFQAALDWEDAEMWLEGAVQNSWSVAEMRRTRTETLGTVESTDVSQPAVAAELDEDFVAETTHGDSNPVNSAELLNGPPIPEGPDFGDEDSTPVTRHDAVVSADDEQRDSVAFVQPFEKLPELPPDFADAFDSLKLSILRHKSEGWQQITAEDVLGALDALKELALAPSADVAPF